MKKKNKGGLTMEIQKKDGMLKVEHSSGDSLGDRMKSYEELSTSRQLMPNCPIYARIDGRAFHTFCRGLKKPYSKAFIEVMQETCKYLVKETTAVLGYVQSDEISLGWIDSQHCPFDGRVQKLESVLASMASAFFVHYICQETPKLKEPQCCDFDTYEAFDKKLHEFFDFDFDNLHMQKTIYIRPPCFDCRVFNVPSLDELANSFLWRENDAIKNSISGMSLHYYSHKELQGKNSDEKVHMMRMKGYCFFEDTEEAFLRGTFWHRENYLKALTDEEVAKIPEKQRENLITKGENSIQTTMKQGDGQWVELKPNTYYCWRSRIAKMEIPYRLSDIENKVDVLFGGQSAILNKENPTFRIASTPLIPEN